jgi:hypothetical protein
MNDDSIYLLKDSGDLERVQKHSYDSEDLIQELIEKYPELLAGEQINPDNPVRWILIKREAGIPSGEELGDRWSVDHLLLDQNAVPTFVETKRSSDTRIRREVVGQMLDYAANAQKYWSVERIRVMASYQYNGQEGADEAIMKLVGSEEEQDITSVVESFWSKVEDNLRNGEVRLFFVADRIPGELRRIIEFLNEQMNKVEVLGVELPQFVGSGISALVPRLIGQTELIRQTKPRSKTYSGHTNQNEFILKISEGLKQFFLDLLSEAQKRGMEIYWGTRSFSLRYLTKDERKLTLFYAYPPGTGEGVDAYLHGYVGYIEDLELQKEIRQKFLSVEGTKPSGNYTVDYEINEDNIENGERLVEMLWEIIQDPRLG